MGTVVALREIAHEDVPLHEGRHGPVVTERIRRERAHPPSAWGSLLARPRELPEVGRVAWQRCGVKVLAWSCERLLWPLREYYATYRPPLRFGAKTGPRGRKLG